MEAKRRGRPRKQKPAPVHHPSIVQYMPKEPDFILMPKSRVLKGRKDLVDSLEGFRTVDSEPFLPAAPFVEDPVAGSLHPT